jgi:hypothetical protein
MATYNNTTSSASALLTNVLQEAIFTASERSIAGDLFQVFDMTGTPGLTAQIPVYPEISAADLTEGTPLTSSESITPATVTITAAEIGARADLTDLLREASNRDVAADIGQMLGAAIGEKIDSNAFSFFDNLTNVVGTGGAEVTPAKVLQAVYTLRNNNAPTDADGDYYCVINPSVAYNIANSLQGAGVGTSANALSTVGNDLLSKSAFMGRLYNVKMFMSTAVANDSANDSVGAVFSPMCFGHIVKRPIVVKSQEQVSARAVEFVGSTARGNAILKNTYGVKLKGESTIN